MRGADRQDSGEGAFNIFDGSDLCIAPCFRATDRIVLFTSLYAPPIGRSNRANSIDVMFGARLPQLSQGTDSSCKGTTRESVIARCRSLSASQQARSLQQLSRPQIARRIISAGSGVAVADLDLHQWSLAEATMGPVTRDVTRLGKGIRPNPEGPAKLHVGKARCRRTGLAAVKGLSKAGAVEGLPGSMTSLPERSVRHVPAGHRRSLLIMNQLSV